MRSTIFAIAIMPAAAFAQEATLPTEAETLAQTQSCPVGMVWSSDANACTIGGADSTPVQSLPGGMGCAGHGAAREVTS